jgi:hypothetical protein
MHDDVLELLLEGRGKIARPHGWCKGDYRKGGAVCALGAIYSPGSDDDEYARSSTEIAAACLLADALPWISSLLGRGRAPSVMELNDARRTRKRDVLALYDAAIARRREETAPLPADMPSVGAGERVDSL